MAFAEHEVLIRRDAMAVYGFLADGMNLPLWRDGVRSVTLLHGSAGTKGAVYRQMVAGRSGLSIPADLEFTHARPGAEIQFRVTFGPGHRSGGLYLSTESAGTRVRFALEAKGECRPCLRSPLREAGGGHNCRLGRFQRIEPASQELGVERARPHPCPSGVHRRIRRVGLGARGQLAQPRV